MATRREEFERSQEKIEKWFGNLEIEKINSYLKNQVEDQNFSKWENLLIEKCIKGHKVMASEGIIYGKSVITITKLKQEHDSLEIADKTLEEIESWITENVN